MSNHFILVAGEASGDILGASLIAHLKKLDPNATFSGIGGPLMIAQGFSSIVPMDRLSVMGLVEVLGRLRELLNIRKTLFNLCIQKQPTAFIGIDSPDFNLPLEKKLKQKGITSIHYVSPSVWAWRQKRIFKIKESVDLMLALFPFEMDIYHQHNIPIKCVGHSLADEISLQLDRNRARDLLNIDQDNNAVFAILPGSRGGEVSRLMPIFAKAMMIIKKRLPHAQFVIPAANEQRREQIEEILGHSILNENLEADMLSAILVIDTHSREAMISANAVLLASGTAALEAMLVKRPMVVAYRFTKLTYAIMSRMIKVPYVSLPNLLAKKALVSELIQDEATPENLADNLMNAWQNFNKDPEILATFERLHRELKLDAGHQAAKAILDLVAKKSA